MNIQKQKNHKNKTINKGFTLVELIIVITILAVLATIAFVSFNGYIRQARDSKRAAELVGITKGLQVLKTTNGIVPTPDNNIEMRVNGELVGFQGVLGNNGANLIGLKEAPTDPVTGEYYTYNSNYNNKFGQVIGFLDNGDTSTEKINKTLLVDGDVLGIVLDTNNNPINYDSSIISQGYFDTYTGTLSNQYVKFSFSSEPKTIMPFILGGQLKVLSTGSDFSQPGYCPENFIPVPGDISLGQPGFCLAKFEASYSTVTGSTLLTKTGIEPARFINLTTDNLCVGNGPNYHVMTLSERLTAANNIYGVSKNWSGSYIKTGYSGDPRTGSSKAFISTSDSNELRSLYLNNGEKIYDFIGNVWEIVNPTNIPNDSSFVQLSTSVIPNSNISSYTLTGYTSGYQLWNNITDTIGKSYLAFNDNNSSMNGLGTFRKVTNGYIFFTGGDYEETTASFIGENGLFSLIINSSSYYSNVGTRCAYIK